MYCGPYLVLERRDKFFCLPIGSKTDVISVDRLKPVFTEEPVSPALPPACGRPPLRVPDPILHPHVVLNPPSAVLPVRPERRVCFQLPPSVPARQNPHLAVHNIKKICSAISLPFLLGGVLWRVDVCQSILPQTLPSLQTAYI